DSRDKSAFGGGCSYVARLTGRRLNIGRSQAAFPMDERREQLTYREARRLALACRGRANAALFRISLPFCPLAQLLKLDSASVTIPVALCEMNRAPRESAHGQFDG